MDVDEADERPGAAGYIANGWRADVDKVEVAQWPPVEHEFQLALPAPQLRYRGL